jgi:hypothetical protein
MSLLTRQLFSNCIGLHLLVNNSQGPPDHPFDEHTDQNSFDRPIGKGAVDLANAAYMVIIIALA